ncbi:MFS transporter [Streptomyces sp. NPDC059679]|uniref:MFS transporter n=1 Tax=Streptomyces sp. NPDC059679 TaxID=3346903 RepID=UPI0036B41CD7
MHGYDALPAGLACLVPMVAIAVGSQTAGRLATRYGIRAVLIAGLVVGAVGTVVVGASMAVDASYLALVPGLVVMGLGQGAGYTLMFGAAALGVAPQEQGAASGVASTSQQVGGAVGLALLVAVAGAGLDGQRGEALRAATTDGLRTAVFVAAAGIVVTALVALGLRRPAPERVGEPVAERATEAVDSRPAAAHV